MYWAHELANQQSEPELQKKFSELADALSSEEETILAELNKAQGTKVDMGGYFRPDEKKVAAAMRPSTSFNSALSKL